MSIKKDIKDLLDAGIISEDVAKNIQIYYQSKEKDSGNRLFAIFGVLGALLVGLGIILIIAHNWDQLPKSIKTVFAFLPLLIGQGLCIYSLLKKNDSTAWRESSTTFTIFAVGACISLISQIYHIEGDIKGFLLTWILLCLPLVYIMRSSIASILGIVAITGYGLNEGYDSFEGTTRHYWLLLPLLFPYYYFLFKRDKVSNALSFHNWFFPLSIIMVLGSWTNNDGMWMYIAYMSLLGVFYIIGNLTYFHNQKTINNGFLIMGALGTVFELLILSFNWFWNELYRENLSFEDSIPQEFVLAALLTLAAAILLFFQLRQKNSNLIRPIRFAFIPFLFAFMIGTQSFVATIIINLMVFLIGVLTIWDGTKKNSLGVMNFGLLIIAALVTCRFFDENISFVIRGILFLLVGIGFFAANYWMLKNRNKNE